MNDEKRIKRTQRLLRKGLPPKSIKKLDALAENESHLEALLLYYNVDKITIAIEDIDQQLAELHQKREEITLKRLDVCADKTKLYQKGLEKNRNAQAEIIVSHSSLQRLKKQIAQIERLQELERQMEAELVT